MQNRKPLDLDDIIDLSRIKVKFNHHKNRILNTKTGIFNSIIAQKLSKIEEKQRKSILQNITEYEHYDSIKNRIPTSTHG